MTFAAFCILFACYWVFRWCWYVQIRPCEFYLDEYKECTGIMYVFSMNDVQVICYLLLSLSIWQTHWTLADFGFVYCFVAVYYFSNIRQMSSCGNVPMKARPCAFTPHGLCFFEDEKLKQESVHLCS